MSALSVRGLSRAFGRTQALSDVDLDVGVGEVVALLGQNGAGKSTLIKVLAGVHRPDTGTIRIGERTFAHGITAAQARDAGLAFVHQDLGLVEACSVAENIAFVAGFTRRRGLISWRGQRAAAAKLLERFGFEIDAGMPVARLDPAQRALVAIARALATDARVIVLDEPTAALPRHEVETLCTAIDRLRDAGVGVLYVTHRLGEVRRLASRAVVLRDGRRVADVDVASTTHEQLVEQIVGRELAGLGLSRRAPEPEAILRVDGVAGGGAHDVSLTVRRGEIVALVGLVGAGQRDVGRMVGGAVARRAGTMRLGGDVYAPRSPRDAIARGVAFLPADRLGEGGFVLADLATNLWTRAGAGGRWLRPAAERDAAAGVLREWSVVPRAPSSIFGSLSGGNQQKVLLAKWVGSEPRVLVVDEPTAGVDVGAREAIYRRIAAAAAGGVATLLVSSDAEEVADLAHRALVLHDGRVASELHATDLTVERITLECARA